MHIDETALRILESGVLADLVKDGAPAKLLRYAHCMIKRLSGDFTMEAYRNERPMLLCDTIARMRKSYEWVRDKMRSEPDKQVMASFDRMTKLLESAKEHNGLKSPVQGLTIFSKGGELRGSELAGCELATFPGTLGRAIEVTIRREKVGPGYMHVHPGSKGLPPS
jgi:hypothetical protein